MEEKNKQVNSIMEQMLESINRLTDSFIGEPVTEASKYEMRDSIDTIVCFYQNALNHFGYDVSINRSTIDALRTQFFAPIHEQIYFDEVTFSKEELVKRIEEKVEEYVLSNFDKWDIKEQGSYIYQKLEDIIITIIQEMIETEYVFDNNEDELFDALYDLIDFDYFYELIDSISTAPVTIQEKLADIGMSEKDFL